MRQILTLFCGLLVTSLLAQDTITVQTLTYDSTGRDYVFDFPADDGTTYRKVIMEYGMRCKDGLVSTTSDRNRGCGEWDYSCNTYLVDSTKVDSFQASHPTHTISGFAGDSYAYTSQPTYTYTQYNQQLVTMTTGSPTVTAAVGSFDGMVTDLFGETGDAARAQYLYTSAELLSAGLMAGPIKALSYTVDQGQGSAEFLRVRMKATTMSELASPVLTDDWTQVYFADTDMMEGENILHFYEDFDWDGESDILVEVSYTGGEPEVVLQSHEATGQSLVSTGPDSYLEFTGAEHIELSSQGLSDIVDAITLSVWTYGDPTALPANVTIFEGVTSGGSRAANVHLPWSNGQIYWDCGNADGYDRINKQAAEADYEGRWNHWAFTKNTVTGSMKIYLNGNLWHSGTGMFRKIDISRMNLGADSRPLLHYRGKVDQFRVWSRELTQAEIQATMHTRYESSLAIFEDVVASYGLDEALGSKVVDAVTSTEGTIVNTAHWREHRGAQRFTNFADDKERPYTIFYQGEYEKSVTPSVQTVAEVNLSNTVNYYSVDGTDLQLDSTASLWQATDELTLDEEGSVLSSEAVTVEGTIEVGSLDYYNKLPSRLEIMSFVTPYGINLDFGLDGEQWLFDVTDFTPILKGQKRMFMGNGGQFQEEMDIKFHFIKGTPPRDVLDIDQIWRPGSQCNYQNIQSNNCFEPRVITARDDASFYKIRSMVTGHGQEGEFTSRVHTIAVDGSPTFVWQGWTECADNPVYPQGGTWIYDRAGWCPGAPTDLHEWDLSPMLAESGEVTLDYNVLTGSGDSRYLINHQLVTYGDFNFDTDLSIEEVMSPTDRIEYGRFNPTCGDPTIRVQNTGRTTITSATIKYGVRGGTALTYEWTGDLPSMETTEIELPVVEPSFWSTASGPSAFEVELLSVNGGSDDYGDNDVYTSAFTMPDVLAEDEMILEFKTNNAGFQNVLRVRDFDGNLLLNKSGLASNTIYRDTLRLEDGCYSMELFDNAGTGIDFWAVNEGSGYLVLRTPVSLIKRFEPDFGSILRYSFVKGSYTNVVEVPLADDILISPNPSTGIFTVDFLGEQSSPSQLLVTDMTGKTVYKQMLSTADRAIQIDLSDHQSGMYLCTLRYGSRVVTKKIVKM